MSRAGQRLILLSDDDEGFALVTAEHFERRLEYLSRIVSPTGE